MVRKFSVGFAIGMGWCFIGSVGADEARFERAGTDNRQMTGGCVCDANVMNPESSPVDILDFGVILGCVFNGECAGCDVSCDVNCDGVVDVDDVGAVWCRSILGGSLGEECCTDPIGACVQGSGCIWTTEAGCAAMNDTWMGPAHTCLFGACITAGVCSEKPEAVCALGGGVFQGVDTECPPQPPTGTCQTGGGCVHTTEEGCNALGGTFLGPGAPCPNNFGACITDIGCSNIGTASSCSAVGGLFLGPGTGCPANSCLTDAGCDPGFECTLAHVCVLVDTGIPTVSTWGLIMLTLLLLTGGKLLGFGRWRATGNNH